MKALTKKKKMVNHVAFLLDASGSMMGLNNATREVFAKLMDGLAIEEKKSGIETRVHVYTFGYDLRGERIDVTPKEAASFSYSARNEGTALVSSTIELIEKLEGYADSSHDVSFLVYVLTDGQNTENGHLAPKLAKLLSGLNDDWTMAIMVPNEGCKRAAVGYGFPSDNIQIWETTAKGIEQLGGQVVGATQSYYSMRTAGVKSTKCLFKLPENLTKTEVRKKLEEVDPADYETLIVRPYYDTWAIKDFVEAVQHAPYRVGAAYYQLTKPEIVQGRKQVAVIEKSTGKMYSGLNARKVLGLPSYDVKVQPADLAKFDIFIQSTSTNRKLVGDTHLIVFK